VTLNRRTGFVEVRFIDIGLSSGNETNYDVLALASIHENDQQQNHTAAHADSLITLLIVCVLVFANHMPGIIEDLGTCSKEYRVFAGCFELWPNPR
jgi:hypothetical protein